MKKYIVNLGFQCHEDWNQMTPQGAGKHCQACNHIVIDFSAMPDADLIQYLLRHKQVCGRFHPTQLNRAMVFRPIKKRSNWPAIAAMLIAGLISAVPDQLHAASTTSNSIAYYPAEKEKNVEPDKRDPQFTIRLFRADNHAPIFYGNISIEHIGTFYADMDGKIVISGAREIEEMSSLWITVSAPGYMVKAFTIQLENIQHTRMANIYLEENKEEMMPSGKVTIHEL